jgi:ribokinase
MQQPILFVLGSYVQALCMRVRSLPQAGESVLAHSLDVSPGGKGFNMAVGARRLGADVRLLMAVGRDEAGDLAARQLQAERISCEHLLRLPLPTGRGVGLINEVGENCIAVYPGANSQLDSGHVAAAIGSIARSQLVCAQFEIGEAAVISAFRAARQHGAATLLNAAPYRPLSATLAALTDTLVLNAREAETWLGLGAETLVDAHHCDAALRALPLPPGIGRIVITLGAHGCVAREAGGALVHQRAFAIEAVDTIGAGDAFCAGLAVALALGLPLPLALRRAAACGALVCAGAGVLQVLPDADAVDRMLRGNGDT